MLNIALVALGSGCGGVLRYLTGQAVKHLPLAGFPYATLMANIAGCFLIGLFFGLLDHFPQHDNQCRMLLITGLCGGFTTFSSFTKETFDFISQGNYIKVALNIAASIVLGLAAVAVGIKIAK